MRDARAGHAGGAGGRFLIRRTGCRIFMEGCWRVGWVDRAVVDQNGAAGDERALPSALGLREAERIARQLGPALHDHGRWVQRIHAILVCRTPPPAPDLAAEAHLASPLGRWLNDAAADRLSRHPQHAAAALAQRRMHDQARRLLAAIGRGEPIDAADYQAFADSIAALERSLETLVMQLWDLVRYTDPLTGIGTRFAMLPRLEEERERVKRSGRPATICMMDIDRFKRINDRHGHHAGDRVLEAASTYLAGHLRRYDEICRYGGEEFVLLLPDAAPADAVPVIDRLRLGLAALPVALPDGLRIRITASFGIAALAPDTSVYTSLAEADRAMYAAKAAGRNCVRRADQLPAAPVPAPA